MRKRATSSDVAKRAGVSRSLVSAFINGTPGITVSEENRAAISHAIKELNYTVNVQAKGIRTGKSHCLAVYGRVYNVLFLQLVEGIQQVSGPAGYHVLLYAEGRNLEGSGGLISLYRQGRIDGIITLDFPDPLQPEWEKAVLENGIPYVSVEGIPAGNDIHTVQTDYGESVRLALDFMWERTGIPPVYMNVQVPDRFTTLGDRLRLETYWAWMKARDLEPHVIGMTDEPWQSGKTWWLQWLEAHPKPLSVLSNWSRGAVAIYRAAYERNWKIGKELFVMAADDTERLSRHMIPPLPCIEVPYKEMGERAFGLLEALMEQTGRQDQEPVRARKEMIPCKLFTGLD